MEIKYIVKALRYSNQYLVADAVIGNRPVPFGFKPCEQIMYQAALFDSKEEALSACEEAAKYNSVSHYMPVILETIV